jgi:peptidoglycan/xylan/chitin deacetylase (PgdA/CDA1 family)
MNYPLELTVMMYHYVRDPGDDAEAGSGIPGMLVKDFETQLDQLSERHTFVTWPEMRSALQEDKLLPSAACLLTFDDGICDHYINIFKSLRDRNISGLFFALARRENEGLTLAHKIHFLLAKLGVVQLREAIWEKLDPGQQNRLTQAEERYRLRYPPDSTDQRVNLFKAALQRDLSDEVNMLLGELFETHVGKENEIARSYYLSADQIQEMSAHGMHFGGHSRGHPWFDWISAEARTAEIRASAEWLRLFEPGPWAFAYPYGGLSEDSPYILKKHGFIAAFTTQTQFRHLDPFFIGRIDSEEVAQDGQEYV